jgi:hypothetical protein
MLEGEFECRGTWLRQEGEMRFTPKSPWLRFTAEEWFEGPGIDFRWRAWMTMPPFIKTRVVDEFQQGRGCLTASVFGIVPVARFKGEAANKGEALRGLLELPWRPFSFREMPCLTWEKARENKLRAKFSDGKTEVAGEFEIGADGRVLGGFAQSRPRLIGKTLVDTPWSTTGGDYRMFGRMRIPVSGEALWHLPEGPFVYWRGRVTDFRILE